MLTRVFFAAVLAGLAAGLVLSTLHHFRTTPLIIAAENFEGKSAHDHGAASRVAKTKQPPAHGEAGHNHKTDHKDLDEIAKTDNQAGGWAPQGGFERTFYSFLSDIMIAIGFAFLLAAVALITGIAITPQNGALWGLVAFTVFTLSPAAGLPPELPGMPTADLVDRQIWWLGCVVAGSIGVALIALKQKAIFIIIGVALIAAPHLLGAPLPEDFDTDVPAHIIQTYVANSLVIMAVTWVVVGSALGLTFQHQKLAID